MNHLQRLFVFSLAVSGLLVCGAEAASIGGAGARSGIATGTDASTSSPGSDEEEIDESTDIDEQVDDPAKPKSETPDFTIPDEIKKKKADNPVKDLDCNDANRQPDVNCP